MERVNY